MLAIENGRIFNSTPANLFGGGAFIVSFFRGFMEHFEYSCCIDSVVGFLPKFRTFLLNSLISSTQLSVIILFWVDDFFKLLKLKIPSQDQKHHPQPLQTPIIESSLLVWGPNFILFEIPSSRQLFTELRNSALPTLVHLPTDVAATSPGINVRPSRVVTPVVDSSIMTVGFLFDR